MYADLRLLFNTMLLRFLHLGTYEPSSFYCYLVIHQINLMSQIHSSILMLMGIWETAVFCYCQLCHYKPSCIHVSSSTSTEVTQPGLKLPSNLVPIYTPTRSAWKLPLFTASPTLGIVQLPSFLPVWWFRKSILLWF